MPIGLAAGSKIYLSLVPVDIAQGLRRLGGEVRPLLSSDPFSGHLFLSAAAAVTA